MHTICYENLNLKIENSFKFFKNDFVKFSFGNENKIGIIVKRYLKRKDKIMGNELISDKIKKKNEKMINKKYLIFCLICIGKQ